MFVNCANLLHPRLSLFLNGSLLSLWCFSTFSKLLFSGFLSSKGDFASHQNNSKYCDWAPSKYNVRTKWSLHQDLCSQCHFYSVSLSVLTTRAYLLWIRVNVASSSSYSFRMCCLPVVIEFDTVEYCFLLPNLQWKCSIYVSILNRNALA